MKQVKAVAVLVSLFLPTALVAQNPQKLPPVKTVDTANVVTVQNARKTPVALFIEWGRFDRRLGVVPALGMSTISLPAWATTGQKSIRLFVHVEGEERDLATEKFDLPRRAHIGLVVPPEGGMPEPPDTMMQVIPPEQLSDATVTVENPRGTPVTIYARTQGFDVKLGEVPAKGRVTLSFPRSIIRVDRTVMLFVHLPNGVELASETLQVGKGQHLGLRVPST